MSLTIILRLMGTKLTQRPTQAICPSFRLVTCIAQHQLCSIVSQICVAIPKQMYNIHSSLLIFATGADVLPQVSPAASAVLMMPLLPCMHASVALSCAYMQETYDTCLQVQDLGDWHEAEGDSEADHSEDSNAENW